MSGDDRPSSESTGLTPQMLSELEAAAAASPLDATLQITLAAAYETAGDRVKAAAARFAALALTERNALALYNIATAYLNQAQLAEAERWYRVTLALDPRLAVAHQNLASLLRERGELEAATEHLRLAYTNQAVYIEAGDAAAPRVLVACAGSTGNVPVKYLMPEQRYTQIRCFVDYASERDLAALPEHQIVFNAIGEPDVIAADDPRLQALLARTHGVVLNTPSHVERTRRDRLPMLLAGIADALTPKARRIEVGGAPTPEARRIEGRDALTPRALRIETGGTLTPEARRFEGRDALTPRALRIETGGTLTPEARRFESRSALTPHALRIETGGALTPETRRVEAHATPTPQTHRIETEGIQRADDSSSADAESNADSADDFAVPMRTTLAAEIERNGPAYPVILRPPASHGGEGVVLAHDRADVDASGLALADTVYATAYHDYRSPDGCYRKYRMIFVDREPYPYHLAIADHWLVHYYTADMLTHAWKLEEEKRFLDDPQAALGARAWAALCAIAQRLDLDYAGIDFSLLPDGSVLVFEANATMLVHPESEAGPLAHKNRHIQAIVDAFARLIQSRL